MIQGKKYRWQLPVTDQKIVLSTAATYNLSFPIAQALVHRGLITREQIDSFLFSTFEKDVAHAGKLKDAQKAVDRILQAIANNEKILVAGDYDVDGVTSSAMMLLCLLPLDADINFFLPNRAKDGYGLSTKIVERAAQNGYTVIVTVDNGITAFKPAQKAKELGVDLIITDHHQPHGEIPDAFCVINPHQEDCEYPFAELAGVGVTFKLLSLLYETKGLLLPHKVYELLMLGTIADVVPLVGENRFWVRYGLNYVNKVESLSLKVLKQNGKLAKPKISSQDVGFSIAPQINALGRLQDARDGVRFLIGSDEKQVQHVGSVLFELNQARKEIERGIFEQIKKRIDEKQINLDTDFVIVTADTGWPTGVIGLVASRLVSAYGRPTILLHLTKDGIAKGSCRSIPEFNLFEGLQKLEHLLIQFGGHAMAAGLSLKIENVDQFSKELNNLVAAQLTKDDLVLKLSVDAQASLSELSNKFVADLQQLEPFGCENKPPVFWLKKVSLVRKPQLLKELHVKCQVFADGVIKPIIFFNRPELFPLLCELEYQSFDIAAYVVENHWNGRVSIELQGLDIAI